MRRYFLADRCFNTPALREFNKNLIVADELVTYGNLLELEEIEEHQVEQAVASLDADHQIIAAIVRPEIDRNWYLENRTNFRFCGYDLVDHGSCISSISNCGAGFSDVIEYSALNGFGLIQTYCQAVMTQLDLAEKYCNESHTYCEIIELWRITAEYVRKAFAAE